MIRYIVSKQSISSISMSQTSRIKLSEWAKLNDYSYNGAYNLFKKGGLAGVQLTNGTILVDECQPNAVSIEKPVAKPENTKCYVYASTGNHQHHDVLVKQVNHLISYCNKHGYEIASICQEYVEEGGVGYSRPKLLELLSDLESLETHQKVLVVDESLLFDDFCQTILERLLKKCGVCLIAVGCNK